MASYRNNKINIIFKNEIFLILLLNLGLQFIVIKLFSDLSLLAILVINLLIIAWFMQKGTKSSIYIYLILLTLIPLLYVNNGFHYSSRVTIYSNLPLYILFVLVVIKYLQKENIFVISLSNFQKIIMIFLFFSFLSSAYGILQGNNPSRVFTEQYNFLYYAFAPIFYYIFRKRDEYLTLFKIISFVFIFVSIEHIFLFLLSGGDRFVSYQSNFTPFVIGFFYSGILFSKRRSNMIILSIILILLLLGEFLTFTRGLWVTTLIVLVSITLLRFDYYKKVKLLAFLSIISVSLMFFAQADSEKSNPQTDGKNLDYRSQSIITPTDDTSFMMRVEFGYYTILKFLSSPIWGTGIGDDLAYKVLDTSGTPKSYPDNSYLYFLWKQGILGIGILLWMYITFFRLTFKVFRFTSDNRVKIISLAILGGTIGLAFNGLLTAVLIKYKLSLLFAFLFAFVDFESKRIKQNIVNEQ
jgi:O-Antigen ligase